MALGLGSARLNLTAKGASPPPVQQIKPARTSIAEDAIFIPKPHKRVDFKVNSGGGSDGSAAGVGDGKPNANPIQLPGQATDNGGIMQPMGSQDAKVMVTGQNIATGSLGEHGLSAEFGKKSYVAPEQLVKTEYSAVPQKDFTAIASQEEGRQTNNAKQTHFTQQYDAYGRPRIGFSREPYDFAATKYVSKTSEIKFEMNMKATKQAYGKYAAPGAAPGGQAAPQSQDPNAPPPVTGAADSAQTPVQQGMIDPQSIPEKLLGADKAPKKGLIAYDPKKTDTLGDGSNFKKGMIGSNNAGAPGTTNAPAPNEALLKGESARTVAEKMGMAADAIMSPSAVAGGQGAAPPLPIPGKGGFTGIDTSLGGKAVSKIAAMMGMNISAVLNARPDKVADFHAVAPLLKSSASISVSA